MTTSEAASQEGAEEKREHRHFIQQIIDRDVAEEKHGGRVQTRFPPEPNGYLHIGHAKAIVINFALAEEFGGGCNLRFDDTNPSAEEDEFVQAIQEDIRWLGFDWGGEPLFASGYFDALYEMARALIEKGLAYVCDLTPEETREYRGTITEPGRNSPFRDRSVEENLELFERMKRGEFEDGSRTLRAKIDMASPNLNLRDPVCYRILRAHHHRTGDAWCIYPMYDFAHGQSDSLEKITHSLCSLEFENHRPLYDWFIENIGLDHHPQQIEFARLNLTYTFTSKRKLRQLVEDGHVTGWDDPRMPTLRALRRRGYTPESIRSFIHEVGVAKFNSTVDMVKLENALRDDLNRRALRRMAVLRPLKVVITNLAEDEAIELEAVNNPEDESSGMRPITLRREVWIERDDFRRDPPRKFFRLGPDRTVRLRYAFCITCNEVVEDASGEVVELRCTYDPATGGGQQPESGKVKGIVHWVNAADAVEAEVRLYDHLFATPFPLEVEEGKDWLDNLNPKSLEVLEGAKLEPALASAETGQAFQFERQGYFTPDVESAPERLVFNRAVSLRDSWAKIDPKGQKGQKGGGRGQKGQKGQGPPA